MTKKLITELESLIKSDDLNLIQDSISKLKRELDNSNASISVNAGAYEIPKAAIVEDLVQISETQTLERTHYYLERLLKGLQKVKYNKVNHINYNRWRDYPHLLTDSLWVMDKRDRSGIHSAGYHGNFIPQIPQQFLERYTKKGDWIIDGFLGSGTTLIECRRMERNAIGIELNDEVFKNTSAKIDAEANPYNVKTIAVHGDSSTFDLRDTIAENRVDNFSFVFLHPPYWDIIKFSDDPEDLSNALSEESFYDMMEQVGNNLLKHLKKGGYFAIVIGDKYENGEWVPLAHRTLEVFLKKGYLLKSTIVKNFETTKAKQQQEQLWRYRALVGGFYIFKHEYIFILQKK